MPLPDPEERTPLVGDVNACYYATTRYNVPTAPPEETNTQDGSIASSVGTDELPPPYKPSESGVPMVTCRVCQGMIDIMGKVEQHVVKCTKCNEATPIKSPPPGKKYIRCPCNCLLICKSESQRIACPRPNCKKIINLTPPANPSLTGFPGMCRVLCTHCQDIFVFNTLNNALAKCPHCKKVSSVGPDFAKCRAIVFMVVSLVLLCAYIAMIVTTVKYTSRYPGIFVAYIGVCLLLIASIYRFYYFCSMKISRIDGPL